ncbi:MAG: hypothetical protein PWR21_241 [Methanoculleus sp.]|nr:hypothetical protein [Methanoculleus sp.]MDK2988504.1 hypothetical protein [Methanoculleus sp.]
MVTKTGVVNVPFLDATSLSDSNCHIKAMKHINAKGEVFQQTSVRIRENVYLLAKKEELPISEAAEQGVIAALRARGVEV